MSLSKILVIEDTIEFQALIKNALSHKYQLTIADTAHSALQALANESFDLILLDVVLPDSDGFKLCTKIRLDQNSENIPIMILSVKNQLDDKIMGLRLGADDYLAKPFEPLELTARVEAKLRAKKRPDEIGRFGNIIINYNLQSVQIDEPGNCSNVDLTPREFRLLSFFIKNQGRILTREQILDSVWGTQSFVTDRTIDTHVYCLRKKLLSKSSYIKSVFGQGYCFNTTSI